MDSSWIFIGSSKEALGTNLSQIVKARSAAKEGNHVQRDLSAGLVAGVAAPSLSPRESSEVKGTEEEQVESSWLLISNQRKIYL